MASPYLNTDAPAGPPQGGPPQPPAAAGGGGSKKGCCIIGAIVGLIVLGCGGFIGYFAMQGIKEAKVWDPYMEEFAASAEFEALPEEAEQYLKTPVISIVLEDNDETESFANDPPYRGDLNRKDEIKAIKAATPEEVRSIILMSWSQIEDGHYQDDAGNKIGDAFVQTCQVQVVDWESKKIVATAFFLGDASPDEIQESEKNGYGPKPWESITEWLMGLEQK